MSTHFFIHTSANYIKLFIFSSIFFFVSVIINVPVQLGEDFDEEFKLNVTRLTV